MSFFQSIFGGPSLVKLARTGQHEAFCRKLLESSVYILDGNVGEGISMDSGEDEVLAYLEARAKHVSANTDASFFFYEEGGAKCFPFFVAQKHAEQFCGAYCGREQRIFAMQTLAVDGPAIIPALQACDEAILNAQCDDAPPLAAETLALLRGMAND